MKKQIKLISLLVVLFLSLITVLPARTKALSNDVSNGAYPYVIKGYDVQIVVNENNTFDITETITVNFKEARHGIIRTIPLTNEVRRLDGTSYTNHARISNIYCDTLFSTHRSNNNYEIKIGDPTETLTGDKTYVIRYTYALGKDQTSKYDELYFNIIGNQWDTIVMNVSFTIQMPKDFDTSKLGFSSGPRGSTDSSRVKYNINGTTITGTLDGHLLPGHGLTVRCELPEGYFVPDIHSIDIWYLIKTYAPVVITLIAILWSFGWGDRDQIIETVEFYPPENKNSLDVGYLYKGIADEEDVTSLLIYLANKGYVSIREKESSDGQQKNDNFVITRLRPYDGDDENERLFMEGLFACKSADTSESDLPVSVTFDDLYDRFYMTMNTIIMNENSSKENYNLVFEKSTLPRQRMITVLMLVVYIMTMLPINMTSHEFPLWLLLCPLGAIAAIVGALMAHFDLKKIAYVCLFSAAFGGIPLAPMAKRAFSINGELKINLVVGLVCLIVLTILLLHSERRTDYGKTMLGKIRGFRNFLMSAEKDRLEALVADNPTYFYDILPYTYVLGVSDKWINKFESIAMQAPDWYVSSGDFSVRSFGDFMGSAMNNASSAMSSSPSSGGSGGGSGGGSSGGGSGGGGGSSW